MFCLIFSAWTIALTAETFTLRDNLQEAQTGDYLVIAAGKTNSLMHIYDKRDQSVIIEEIVIPDTKCSQLNWREWVAQNAPGNTSWVLYEIDLNSGQMIRYYSFTKEGWFEIPEADNFLFKLLNLTLTKIPDQLRKRIGTTSFGAIDRRPAWQPRVVLDGKIIRNVPFTAWRTQWPKDNSDLSGKNIEIYLPQDHQLYPAYFPYWLQINGMIGKAKIRVIDSGRSLHSPKPSLDTLSTR